MPRAVQTDNLELACKLDVRRTILRELTSMFADNWEPLAVLDLYAGQGRIWKQLRQECKVEAYTPCDKTPRMPGTIKGDAERLVDAFDLRQFNVIDIDCYGEPWPVWLKIVPRIKRRTAVFLTHGVITHGTGPTGYPISNQTKQILGIPLAWPVPKKPELSSFAVPYFLCSAADKLSIPVAIRKSAQRYSGGTATYYGLICEPIVPGGTI